VSTIQAAGETPWIPAFAGMTEKNLSIELKIPGYNGFGGEWLKECKSCAFAFFSRCHALGGNQGIKINLWLHELNDV